MMICPKCNASDNGVCQLPMESCPGMVSYPRWLWIKARNKLAVRLALFGVSLTRLANRMVS